MTRTRRLVWSLPLLAVLAVSVVSVKSLLDRARGVFDPDLTEGFFDKYVGSDGRVVRHDQGGDTVSEGQAYAMLLAVALDDEDRFASVWRWTQRNLQRSDGLLSWRWSNGSVADDQPAADADVDAAYALLLASERFDDRDLASQAERIARAIVSAETVDGGEGPVLVAGPWARERRVVNPSYLDARAFFAFAELTGDRAWRTMARTVPGMLEALSDAGLPPDWAVLGDDGSMRPAPGPDEKEGAGQYGLDAARTVVRAAYGGEATRAVAARWWPQARARADNTKHPLYDVAAAAAADAAGETGARDDLLRSAADRVRGEPSYYGWAWAALAPALLDPAALR